MRHAALALLLGACSYEPPKLAWTGGAPQAQGVLMSTQRNGSVTFVRRLDGRVEEIFRSEVTGLGSEFVVLTGPEAGTDQCKVLILAEEGEVRAEYRPPGRTPWPASDKRRGEFRRVRISPLPGRVMPFQRADRRYLCVATTGDFAPVSFTILEWTGTAFEERFVFWNFGHIRHVMIEEPYLILIGVTSAFPGTDVDYTPFATAFRLGDILRNQPEAIRGESPIDGSGGRVPGAPYLWYVRMPDDHNWHFQIWSPRVEGDTLVAPTMGGLRYLIDLRSGEIELDPSELYRREFEFRPERDKLPDLTGHLKNLKDEIYRWGPGD